VEFLHLKRPSGSHISVACGASALLADLISGDTLFCMSEEEEEEEEEEEVGSSVAHVTSL
jgi:hypothetical protein